MMNQSSTSKRPKKIGCTIAIVIAIVLFIGFVSIGTTSGVGEGTLPLGEFHLKIVNENGDPVRGAVLNIFEKRTKEAAFGFPVNNHKSSGDLISNEEGVIIASHIPEGFEFAASCFRLFWVFPMCDGGAPQFDFQISANGYKNLVFSNADLFEPAYNDKSSKNIRVTIETGEKINVPVYELMFTLEK
jgi:hypothetical protein